MKKLFFLGVLLFSVCGTGLKSQSPTIEWARGIAIDDSTRLLEREQGLDDVSHYMASDPAGNIYIAGRFYGSADFDPGPESNIRQSAGSADIFVQKLDARGRLLWVQTIGGSSHEEARSIAVDANGHVHITGYYNGTVDFDPGPDRTVWQANDGTRVFILKLDSDGGLLWVKGIELDLPLAATGATWGQSIAVDTNGNVLVSAGFIQTIEYSEQVKWNTYANIIQKFDAEGIPSWKRWIYGTPGLAYESASITTDAAGNTYLAAHFSETVDFDPGPGEAKLTAKGRGHGVTNMFVQKLDTEGNFVWVKAFPGAYAEFDRFVAADSEGNVYLTGQMSRATFETEGDSLSISAVDRSDAFVAKLNPDGNALWAGAMGGINNDRGRSVTVDAAGNILVVGEFRGSADLDPGPDTLQLATRIGVSTRDVFVQKLDAAGKLLWAEVLGGPAEEFGHFIAVDEMDNIVVSGHYESRMYFEPETGILHLGAQTGSDIFIIKLSGRTVGVNDSQIAAGIALYPNPATEFVYIDNKNSNLKRLELRDISGRLLEEKTIRAERARLDIRHLAAGTYFVTVHEWAQRFTTLLVKH